MTSQRRLLWPARLLMVLMAVVMLTGSCRSDQQRAACVFDGPQGSVAGAWIEVVLDGVRRDFPAPTVHARNLHHTSMAMYDAWAAYEPGAVTVGSATVGSAAVSSVSDLDPEQRVAAQLEAVSWAAHTVVKERYIVAVGGTQTAREAAALLESVCVGVDSTRPVGEHAERGVAIGRAVLDASVDDGALESDLYFDPSYRSANEPLQVSEAISDPEVVADPDRWQPLQMEARITQNGLRVDNVQGFIGSQWGALPTFSARPADDYVLHGPPLWADIEQRPEYVRQAMEVVEFSSLLGNDSDEHTEIGPRTASAGLDRNPTLEGHEVNPVTGEAYEANEVRLADYLRAVAEYWADGPDSETPPGHWNALALTASDELAASGDLRIGGRGGAVHRLEWDVKLSLVLNGALHDAAVLAWGGKAEFDSVRPITMIRWLAANQALPPDSDLVRALPGGDAEILAWTPDVADVAWTEATRWFPYQEETFVTPSFPGYPSGHSTFSMAAATVLEAFTGSAYFPGGLASHTIEAGTFSFSEGPATDVRLEWATYRDAAVQAGFSRIPGGIHITADDRDGRQLGQQVGESAVRTAWSLWS